MITEHDMAILSMRIECIKRQEQREYDEWLALTFLLPVCCIGVMLCCALFWYAGTHTAMFK